MLSIVKNTTILSPFDLLCPHICRGCGGLGKVLCDCCKNYILEEHLNFCPCCKRRIDGHKCDNCALLPPTTMIGWKNELIGKMVEEYKYKSVKAIGNVFAELLDESLPFYSDKTVVVPLPTINKHIRERGFDHTLYLAKKLVKLRGWRVDQVLKRANNSVQVGAGESTRVKQAFSAYRVAGRIEPDIHYLLLDDVWTTGASLAAATRKLREAGALKISIAVLAVTR